MDTVVRNRYRRTDQQLEAPIHNQKSLKCLINFTVSFISDKCFLSFLLIHGCPVDSEENRRNAPVPTSHVHSAKQDAIFRQNTSVKKCTALEKFCNVV